MCELDIIFNFEKAYFILDEFIISGEVQETSKQLISNSIEASDLLQEVSRSPVWAPSLADMSKLLQTRPIPHRHWQTQANAHRLGRCHTDTGRPEQSLTEQADTTRTLIDPSTVNTEGLSK